jgi:5-methyltetrahydropteroyltriglutamate--homocysteine methyltransferase
MGLLKGKDVHVGVIDVASNIVETPQEVAAVLREAMQYVPVEHMLASTNCGMAPMPRSVAYAKLRSVAGGAALVRKELGIQQ